MCQHNDFKYWLNQEKTVRIRICVNCKIPDSLDCTIDDPHWKQMSDQTVGKGGDFSNERSTDEPNPDADPAL